MLGFRNRLERDAVLLAENADPETQAALAEVIRDLPPAVERGQTDRLPPKQIAILVALLIALYFPIATYLNNSYVPTDTSIMRAPFKHLAGNSYSSVHFVTGSIGDSEKFPNRSTLDLFENGKKLGPEHSPHHTISTEGRGAYSQWFTGNEGYIIIFSTSDNSDPNTNGRTYTAKAR